MATETTRVWAALRMELVRFVRKRVRDEALAEDIAHDVLHKAYAQRDTLREPGKLRPWLYQIARSAIAESYRARKPAAALSEEPARQETAEAEHELARCLTPLVKGLPPLYRAAVTLADVEGLTQEAVAASLGLSLSGAKSRIQRARKMLAESLEECCRIELDRRGGIADYQCPRECGNCASPPPTTDMGRRD